MSRRKQEKPQHRKTIDSADQVHDLLICGDCHEEFPLHSIVPFIQHKIRKCGKENVKPCHEVDDHRDSQNDEGKPDSLLAVVSGRGMSITAPISRKDSRGSKDSDLRDSVFSASVFTDPPPLIPKEEVHRSVFTRSPSQSSKYVDRSVNTIYTEPQHLECCACKEIFTSAWTLLQHAQGTHGMNIYLDHAPSQRREKHHPEKLPLAEKTQNDHSPKSSTSSAGVPSSPIGPHSFPKFHSAFTDRRHSSSNHNPFLRPPGLHEFPFGDRFMQMMPPSSVDQMTRYRYESSRPSMGMDAFYSQTLREMARSDQRGLVNVPTSPIGTRNTSPYSQSPCANSSSLTHHLPPPKQKACEFCGKCFRFQSNLIVHRRSHTGEKPYKCSLCPHACTQASKLKRHMKTHRKSSTHSSCDGADETASNLNDQTSPNSKNMEEADSRSSFDQDSKNDSESEGEEEEEEIEEEEFEEEEEGAESPEDMEDSPKDLSKYKDSDSNSRFAASSNHRPTDLSMRKLSVEHDNREMVKEVMDHTGLSNFEAYQEAFQRALEENTRPENFRKLDEEVSREIVKDSGQDDDQQEERSPGSSFGKRIKLENVGDNHRPTAPDPLFTRNFEPFLPFFINHGQFPNPNSLPLSYPRQRLSNHPPLNRNGVHDGKPMSHSGMSSLPSPLQSGSRKEIKRSDTCEFCGKVFKNCSNLTVHRRSHTGEKPYKCSVCSYACAQSSKLTRHMRTHGRTGKEVYRCRFCSMPFSVASTLEKHMRKCMERNPMPMRGLVPISDTDHSHNSTHSPTSYTPPSSLARSPIAFTPTSSAVGGQSPNSLGPLVATSELPRWSTDGSPMDEDKPPHSYRSVSPALTKVNRQHSPKEQRSPEGQQRSPDVLMSTNPVSLTTT